MDRLPPKPLRAFITGITGQDGSYLAELLLSKGYEVCGLVRRTSHFNRERIDHLYPDPDQEEKLHLVYGDITDPFSILHALKKFRPTEIYHLAAQSHVAVSWETPLSTAMTTGMGTLNLLEAVRFLETNPKIYLASTSELYAGLPEENPYDESSIPDPRSPYGTAKLYGHQLAKNYRDAFGMWIARGILFNHESPRRGENFVTQKIVQGAVKNKTLHLGNLDAKRDWGHAEDYVEAMWLMLQQDKPDDYVICTGEQHSVDEFIDEVGRANGKPVRYVIDKRFKRPNEVWSLRGNPEKARKKLGWKPKRSFKELVSEMVAKAKGL